MTKSGELTVDELWSHKKCHDLNFIRQHCNEETPYDQHNIDAAQIDTLLNQVLSPSPLSIPSTVKHGSKKHIHMVSQLEKHKKLLLELQDNLKQDFPESSKNLPVLYRFLKARKFDLKEAEIMYRKRQFWIKEFDPQSIKQQDVQAELDTNKAILFGKDKHGRPCIVVNARNHLPNSSSLNDTWKLTIYQIEQGLKNLSPIPFNQFVVLYDMGGTTRKHMDIPLIKKFVRIGDLYPELLGSFYMVNCPSFVHLLFPVVSRLLDPVTRKKLLLIKKMEQLLDHFDKDQLLSQFGGSNNNNNNNITNEKTEPVVSIDTVKNPIEEKTEKTIDNEMGSRGLKIKSRNSLMMNETQILGSSPL